MKCLGQAWRSGLKGLLANRYLQDMNSPEQKIVRHIYALLLIAKFLARQVGFFRWLQPLLNVLHRFLICLFLCFLLSSDRLRPLFLERFPSEITRTSTSRITSLRDCAWLYGSRKITWGCSGSGGSCRLKVASTSSTSVCIFRP